MMISNETKTQYLGEVDPVLGRELGQNSEIREKVKNALANALAIRNHDIFQNILKKFYVTMGYDLDQALSDRRTELAMVFPEKIECSTQLLFESLKTGSAAGFDELLRRGFISKEERDSVSVNVD